MSEAQTAVTPALSVRVVAEDQPWRWLQLGWRDLTRMPSISLAYGAGVVAAGYVLAFALWQADWFSLVLPLAGGFLLLAPFVAVGLYEGSRRLESGEPFTMSGLLLEWRRPMQVGAFGVILILLHLAWMRTALLWFMLYFHAGTPPLDRIPYYLLDAANLPFLVVGTAMGAGFALITFAVSAISLPLLVDRDADVITAVVLSVKAVIANPKAMLLWAGLIVFFTAVGLATFFIGLGLLFPLIAHATWHAYRDLVA